MKNLVKALTIYEYHSSTEERKLKKSAALFHKAACNDAVLVKLRRVAGGKIGEEENEGIELLIKAIHAVRDGKLYKGSTLFHKVAEEHCELAKMLLFWDALADVDAGVDVEDDDDDDDDEEEYKQRDFDKDVALNSIEDAFSTEDDQPQDDEEEKPEPKAADTGEKFTVIGEKNA
ncbi:MAG: hypothetical protein LBU43_08055 [Candidatus Accumulibacter sp.]|jgi:uncharacterized protein (DUF1810 family)|nr:hypothetical protein [Accumulibacter sp.]